MSDDQDGRESKTRKGVRKDGKPFKENNTGPDGHHIVGHRRPPVATRFAKNDGRKRGRRAKGTKNVLTEWREELATKMTITENGVAKKITKRRALIKAKIDRGIRKSDRAAETALRYAEMSERREPGVPADDMALIEAWLASQLISANSDDLDDPDALNHTADDDAESDDA